MKKQQPLRVPPSRPKVNEIWVREDGTEFFYSESGLWVKVVPTKESL